MDWTSFILGALSVVIATAALVFWWVVSDVEQGPWDRPAQETPEPPSKAALRQ